MIAAQDFILVTTTATSVSLMGVQSTDLILNFSSFSLMRDLNQNRNCEGKDSEVSLGLDSLLVSDISVFEYDSICSCVSYEFYIP